MNAYTLEELAWFNRTLFPNDVYEKLKEILGHDDAKMISDFYKRNTTMGVVGLYQEFISDKTKKDAIEKMLFDTVQWLRNKNT